MKRAVRAMLALLPVLVLAGPPTAWAAAPARDLESRIIEAAATGRLDRARADLYRLFAVRAPERLPPEYQAPLQPETRALRGHEQNGPAPIRCGTPILRAVRAQLADWDPELRAAAEAVLDPPRPVATRGIIRVAQKSFTPTLDNWIVTENFSIEWGPNLTNEDGTTPVRDADADGIPDVVELWASYFEASYEAEVQEMGFTDPALGQFLIPVYLGNSDPTTTIENIGSGTYAFTQSDDPLPFIVVNNDLTFVPFNDAGRAASFDQLTNIRGAMRITAAHELFHVIHFLYEPSSWIPTADDWWFEASSTWIEDEVFDSVNDYHQYFGIVKWTSFVEQGLPVRSSSGDYVTRAYGNAIFAKYLAEHVGGQESMADVWGLIRPLPGQRVLPALDEYARNQGYDAGLGELFLGFAAARSQPQRDPAESRAGLPWSHLSSQRSGWHGGRHPGGFGGHSRRRVGVGARRGPNGRVWLGPRHDGRERCRHWVRRATGGRRQSVRNSRLPRRHSLVHPVRNISIPFPGRRYPTAGTRGRTLGHARSGRFRRLLGRPCCR
jgi:hypothetical protein